MDESGYTGAPFYGLPPDSVWTVKWSKYHTLRYGVTITISDGPEKIDGFIPKPRQMLKVHVQRLEEPYETGCPPASGCFIEPELLTQHGITGAGDRLQRYIRKIIDRLLREEFPVDYAFGEIEPA